MNEALLSPMSVAGEGNLLPFKPSSSVLGRALIGGESVSVLNSLSELGKSGEFWALGAKWPSSQHLGLIRRPSRNLVVTCSRIEQLL
jgi:hypothetical protein